MWDIGTKQVLMLGEKFKMVKLRISFSLFSFCLCALLLLFLWRLMVRGDKLMEGKGAVYVASSSGPSCRTLTFVTSADRLFAQIFLYRRPDVNQTHSLSSSRSRWDLEPCSLTSSLVPVPSLTSLVHSLVVQRRSRYKLINSRICVIFFHHV